jgi:broad specificity phosphatase PhoE
MASIYLIRHGQASFGQENYDQLSDLGQRQATRLGSVLAQRLPVFDAVCLGTMQRHRQTAECCLSGFGQQLDQINPVYDAGWNEYDHQNILACFRPEFHNAASMQDYLGQQVDPKRAFEEGFNDAMDRWISGEFEDYTETWQSFTARVHQALENTLVRYPDASNIAIFTSGGPISLVCQHLLGVAPEKIMTMNWTLLNCGVSKLVATGSRLFVASLNEHSHFEGIENKHFITYS